MIFHTGFKNGSSLPGSCFFLVASWGLLQVGIYLKKFTPDQLRGAEPPPLFHRDVFTALVGCRFFVVDLWCTHHPNHQPDHGAEGPFRGKEGSRFKWAICETCPACRKLFQVLMVMWTRSKKHICPENLGKLCKFPNPKSVPQKKSDNLVRIYIEIWWSALKYEIIIRHHPQLSFLLHQVTLHIGRGLKRISK